MVKITSILLFGVLLISGCSLQDEEVPQSNIYFEIEVNHIKSIDEFPELDPPWIVRPTSVISHDDGFILMDSELKRIHVLQQDGTLLTAFGREGRGPGELLGGFPFTIKQEVSVSDINNARNTTFDLSGNFLRHVIHASNKPVVTGRVHPWKENRYLTATYSMNHSECIFFELNEIGELKNNCFGNYKKLQYSEIELLKHIGRNGAVGDIHFIEPDRFMFAPAYYYGKNYVYSWNKNEWVQEKVIKGFSYHEVAVIEKSEHRREPGYVSIQYDGTEAMIAQILSRSFGYYAIGKYLFHITRQLIDNEEITIIELFTTDGVYLGHQKQDFPTSAQGKYGMSVFENYLAIVTSLDLDIYEIDIDFKD
ncbi:MAG: 6-bladed beta-propeller [Balneolales bacterium]|nr:6-bladed beta-propeller [Balneolales bacterium]